MKTRLLILLLCASPLLAQQTVTVDDMQFTMIEDVWVHDALPDEYDVEERFSAVHEDEKWRAWLESGNDRLRAVLELGPNVAFIMVSAEDDAPHVFTVWENDDRLDCAVNHDRPYVMGDVRCPKIGWWWTVGLPVTAGVAAVVIIEDQGGGSSGGDVASKVRKQF